MNNYKDNQNDKKQPSARDNKSPSQQPKSPQKNEGDRKKAEQGSNDQNH